MVRPQLGRGSKATYIPELDAVSPDQIGLAVIGIAGDVVTAGDADVPFSLQSLTKVPALLLALNIGGDEIWERVGKEPSGAAFNNLAQLELEKGFPRNPFINSGAIAVTDYLLTRLGRDPADAIRAVLSFAAGGCDATVDEAVAQSEIAHAFTNRAIANMLYLHGTIRNDPEVVLRAYCRQCAIRMSLRDLVKAFAPLACGGYSPFAKETLTTTRTARRVNALMMTCGLYDAVGSFAYRVGLPAKSGVGGGVVAVAPGVGVLGAWCPELDRFGNSLIGVNALELLVRTTDLSLL